MIDEIKKYVKEILMIVEFEIWERNREKHMILQTRNIQNNMTMLPYESDFMCLIHDYCKMNRIYINEIKFFYIIARIFSVSDSLYNRSEERRVGKEC